jgi:hypothetical protein
MRVAKDRLTRNEQTSCCYGGKTMSLKKIFAVGATILSLMLGSMGISAVSPDQPEPDHVFEETTEIVDAVAELPRWQACAYGVVQSVQDGVLTAASPIGMINLVTDVNTIFLVDRERVGLDSVAVGDSVGAIGWWEEGGVVFHAFVVTKHPSDYLFSVEGKLTDIQGSALTVAVRPELFAAVHVGDDTVYHIRGVDDAGLQYLEIGMRFVARGTLNADGRLQAQVVNAGNPAPSQGRLQGEISVIDDSSFTIRTLRGQEILVEVTRSTKFRMPGVENPSFADLQVGDRVAVTGKATTSADDADERIIQAVLVIVLPEPVVRLPGKVSGIDGTILLVETPRGTVNVITDGETAFHIRGVDEPGLDDVQVGAEIVASGAWQDDVTFHADNVGVLINE